MDCLQISIRGVVQGVGFRPFIYDLANDLSLKGYVTNTSDGVSITVEGDGLDVFVEKIRTEAPPLARIMGIDVSPAQCSGFPDFSIRESADAGRFTLVSPDVSICADCLRELFDSNDRRYLYPFINCTNCGPRYSITRSVPYDRVNTTMRVFAMCPECEAEYRNPADRRFHAQPNACAVCGPRVSMKIPGDSSPPASMQDAVRQTIRLLLQGRVVAIKGLGGFHLACDALNSGAVERLRSAKRKSNKPFALMALSVEVVRKFCFVSEAEEALLRAPFRPIVLLRKRETTPLPDAVAPRNSYLGFMLPYTPLHYLLFRHPLQDTGGRPADTDEGLRHFEALVMTSGNVAEEPLVIDNDEAFSKLAPMADAFLMHDRDIFMRVDDSVVYVRSDGPPADSDPAGDKCGSWWNSAAPLPVFLRRARGYAPDPIDLGDEGPDVLGCGADLKNTFTLTKGRYAIPSQHIGDMENYETLLFFEETLRNLKTVYRAEPAAIAYDLHPGYLSSRWAIDQGGRLSGVQHHYAHIASVMAERRLSGKVIGVAFDGTGYGDDGTLWGGEFLIADTVGFTRAGHIEYVALPGGETAVREPWRTGLSYLYQAAGDEIWDYMRPTGFVERYGKGRIEEVLAVIGQKGFSPLSSGAGRLFDAVSAVLGVCDRNTFEGEAAIALEALVVEGLEDDYPVDIRFREPMSLDFSSTLLGILNDMEHGVAREVIATRFHNAVAAAVITVVAKLALTSNIRKVVLSGGVFQNRYLTVRVMAGLRREGLDVYTNELVPCNDAGISLGQAYVLRERLKTGKV